MRFSGNKNTVHEDTSNINNNNSALYLAFTFGVGISIIAIIVYMGTTRHYFWASILIGGIAQVLFRVGKRIWSNALKKDNGESLNDTSNPFIQGFVETLSSFKIFATLYAAMIIVSAFWYGVGAFFAWVF